MNYAKAGVFFFFCWLVQTTLLWRIWPFGAAPSLILCATVCFAWLYDASYALVFGSVFGLFLDLQVHTLIGVTGLTLVFCCVPAMILRLYFNPERILPVIVAALAATPIYVFFQWGIHSLFGAPQGFLYVMGTVPELLIPQTLICIILHLLFVRTIIKDRKDRRFIGGAA